MDVRCDRCETEYELDDAIVTDAGTSVQCTTCGHTFIVTRGSSSPLAQTTSTGGSTVGLTPPGGITDGPGPEVLEWTLSTDDGKVHRFRDLTVLQKWVVERKVTRSDQVSRSGGPWLSLADVVELAPFFKVVDEADRARATTISSPGMTSMPGMVSAAQSRAASGPVRMPAVAAIAPPLPPAADPIRPVSEDGPTVPNRRLPGTLDGPSIPQPGIRPPDSRAPAPRVPAEARLPGMGGAATRAVSATPRPPGKTEIVFGPNITAETQALDSDFLQPSRRGRTVALALVLVAVAGGASGYWWWMQQQGATPGAGPAPSAAGVSPPAPSAPATAASSAGSAEDPKVAAGGRPEGEKDPPGGNSGDADQPAATTGGAGTNGPAPHPSPTAGSTPGAIAGRSHATPSPHAATARAGRGASAPAAAPARGGGAYDRLVQDADRLLDRGNSAKADKLYAQALAVRPDGVAALTGAAYVLLDRQRHFKAIETFRRALAIQPSYGPALFGIAESYRARGDNAQALGAYRQYLATTPTGADAPAARRQIKDLEAGTAPPPAAGEGSGSPPTGE